MTETIHSRLQVALAAAAVLCAAGLVRAEDVGVRPTSSQADAARSSREALHQGMRKLWSDHVFWTREYVLAAIDGPQGAAQAAAGRLMRNQEDIGAAVAQYYGAAAGSRLTSLLKQHIQIAVDLVAAAKAGDQAKAEDANHRWGQNAEEIATFLSTANPNWSRPALVEMMRMHLETTTREVEARLHKTYAEDVKAFDAVYEHILHMADVLADGIVKQFPDRFAA